MKFFGKLYAFLFMAIAIGEGLTLFNIHSEAGLYYLILFTFNKWYALSLLANVLNVFLCLAVAVLIFFYAFRQPIAAPSWLFYLRLLSELTGHSYEMQLIKSAFLVGFYIGLLAIVHLVLPILPSYILQWRLTFIKSTKR